MTPPILVNLSISVTFLNVFLVSLKRNELHGSQGLPVPLSPPEAVRQRSSREQPDPAEAAFRLQEGEGKPSVSVAALSDLLGTAVPAGCIPWPHARLVCNTLQSPSCYLTLS